MATYVMAGAAVASLLYGVYSGEQARSQQNQAQDQAQKAADAQAAQAQQSFNQANQQKPNSSAILSAAQQAGKTGASGTMLTGPLGVDPSALSLGKSTLLGS